MGEEVRGEKKQMSNQDLYDRALKAISELFEDTSVPQSTTWEALDELAGEIELLQDSLDRDAD